MKHKTKHMKNELIYRLAAGVLAVMSLCLVTSCDNESDPKPEPGLTLSEEAVTEKPGSTVTLLVSVDAPNGGRTLQISGVDVEDIELSGSRQEDVEVNIPIPANAVVASAITAVFTAIDKENKSSAPVEFVITVGDPLVILEGNITTNTTLDATKRYLIKGKVYVNAPSTLTIPAGTVLFGDKTTQAALIINRGAKIDARGTASSPIVMTSYAPKGFRNRGDWGGLVILGKAYNSNGASATIEGITASVGSENGVYGPDTGSALDDDNSGFLQYVRIEYAGIALSQDNELNSLTMGSVGSGTTIDHIMVSYGNDDAYEWFGGSVNHKYLIAFATLDDDFDTDRGYNGKVQFGAVIRDPGQADFSGSRAWESSSNSNTPPVVGGTSRHSAPTFSHITVWGPNLFRATANVNSFYRAALEINSSSGIKVHNSIITGFPTSAFFATAGSTVTGNVFAANGNAQAADGASKPATFSTDNTLEADVTKIFGPFASGSLYSVTSPPVFQSATSPYLTGAVDLSADPFFENASYKGAFADTPAVGWEYTSGWINFDPNNASY
jgi:hypothetical protein